MALEPDRSAKVAALEQQITTLSGQLEQAKAVIQQWTDTNASLSRSAAEARAKNQGMGRGFLGGLLGSKFRGAMRTGAAASNAAIAKDVADKRERIASAKREAQELARQLQTRLTAAKQELKALTTDTKVRASTKTTVAKATASSLDLLQKLKQAHDAGILTDAEYEEKRKKLVSDL